MVTLDEIEAAIHQLPNSEVWELVARLQTYIDDMWDRQLEADLESGKLDTLIARAESDIAADRVRGLDEVIHNA